MKNGVYQVLSSEYQQKLETFLSGFEDLREASIANYTPEVLRQLPYVSFDTSMWKLRQYDLKLISNYLKSGGKALEIGAWNSWLTQHIAASGMETTAVDIFIHDRDGLGAKQHYEQDWRAIQMDLRQLDLIDDEFDMIVINRSFQYLQDMQESIRVLKQRLKKGGVLIITGLTLESNPARIQEQLDAAAASFESKYGSPFLLHEFQGYNTKESLNQLKNQGVQLKVYPELRIQTLVANVLSSQHKYYYGIFEKQ